MQNISKVSEFNNWGNCYSNSQDLAKKLDFKGQKIKDFNFGLAMFRSLWAIQVEISKPQWKYLGCSYTCESGWYLSEWDNSQVITEGEKIEESIPMIWESASFGKKEMLRKSKNGGQWGMKDGWRGNYHKGQEISKSEEIVNSAKCY